MHIKKYRQLLVLLVLLAATSISVVYAGNVPEQVSVPILLYHDIQNSGKGDSTIAERVFLSHLDALQQAGYETVTFQQLISFVKYGISLPEKPILITFDDGYLSNYKIAWPAFRTRGMVGTIFVVGSSMGKETYMIDSGVMSIQSHTYDLHQYRPLEPDGGREGVLPKEGEDVEAYRKALQTDFQLARDALQQKTGEAVQVLAYPYGLYTQDSETISAQLGFSITLTTRAQPALLRRNDPSSLRLMGRYSIDDCTPQELLKLIQA